jgi:hypothetical protein
MMVMMNGTQSTLEESNQRQVIVQQKNCTQKLCSKVLQKFAKQYLK